MELNAEGTMPRKEMIPFERFRIHDRVRALVAEIKETGRGPQIIITRSDSMMYFYDLLPD